MLAEFSDDFEIETLTPRDAKAQMHHPARQVCTNCGAVLGVRAAICPKCHADIRTGQAVVTRQQVKTKKSSWPIVIGAIVGVIILAGAAVLIAALFASG